MKIRLGLVDDHQIVIDGLKSILQLSTDKVEICFESTDPQAVLEKIEKFPIDILLSDMMMPQMSGQHLSKLVHAKFPSVKIIILSMNTDASLINCMIEEENIKGYLPKNLGKEELIRALNHVQAGGYYYNDELLQKVTAWKDNQSHLKKNETGLNISCREKEIIDLMTKEFSNKEIANQLFISERTVETHRKNIFRKTGAKSLLGLIRIINNHQLN